MSGDRIETTKNALKLFMQSLPEGSKFQIISFGTLFEPMKLKDQEEAGLIDYTEQNLQEALIQISTFDSDMGGTEIFQPLKYAFKLKSENKKRIFLLTDGSVSGRDKVIDLIS